MCAKDKKIIITISYSCNSGSETRQSMFWFDKIVEIDLRTTSRGFVIVPE